MDLYNKIILDLNRNPPNFLLREDAQHVVKAYNAYCGDKYTLHLDYKHSATEISFQGHGCAVSKASTAILTECVQGKSWKEIITLCTTVLEFLEGNADTSIEPHASISSIDMRLDSLSVARNYPGRYDCAALSWEEMRAYCLKQLG